MNTPQLAKPADGRLTRAILSVRFLRGWALPEDPLDRARGVLFTFSVVSVVILAAAFVIQYPRLALPQAMVAGASVALILKWRLEWARHPVPAVLDMVEVGALAALGLGLGVFAVLLLLYTRIAAKALDVGVGRLSLYTLGCLGAFAVAVTAAYARAGAGPIEYAALASGFAVVAPVMHLLRVTLEELSATQHRERALRLATSSLAAAGHPEAVWAAATDAVRSLLRVYQLVDVRVLDANSGDPQPAAGGLHTLRLAVGFGTSHAGVLAITAAAPLPERAMPALESLAKQVAVALDAVQLADEQRTQATLRASESAFRLLFDANPQPLWVCDRLTLRILAANDAVVRQYGYDREDLLAMHVFDLLPVDQRPAPSADSAERDLVWRVPRHQRKDGTLIDVEVTTSGVRMGDRDALLMLAADVTERRALDAQLRHQALHDSLTGLPNRTLLAERTGQTLMTRRPAVMLVFDLAGFKSVNDSYGHAEGDAVLETVAARLRESVRPGDTPARLGGDEFAVLLNDIIDLDEAKAVARRIENALAEPFFIGTNAVPIACSIGIAATSDGRTTVAELLRRADAAMYAAKKGGRRTQEVYEPGTHPNADEHLELLDELRAALANGQLHLFYQPQVSLTSGRINAVEALIRWHHPVRGVIAPDVFIPIAEQGGLISSVTEWVLRTACAQAESWRASGWPDVRVAVNISGHDLDGSALIDHVTAALAMTDIEPWQLELELTETAVVRQPNAVERLHALRAIGLSIAIDDFGTGYSMLSRLRSLPADCVKIDGSFVRDLASDDVAATIVRATIEMGRKLGLTVVGEGVQDSKAMDMLRAFGCHAAQGYYVSRPLPPDELHRWVDSGPFSAAGGGWRQDARKRPA